MAVVSTLSNHYKYQLMSGEMNFASDVFKIALLHGGYTFDKDTDAVWTDVSEHEISGENGYTTDGLILATGELTEDDTNDRANMTWGTPSWLASGGDLGGGETGAAIIYNDTSPDDAIIGCIDFGTDYTVADGVTFQIQSVVVRTT